MLKKILLILLGVFVVIQFIQIDVSIPEDYVPAQVDFLAKYDTPDHIKTLIKDGCYDCHSYETEHAWYMSVAPISWFTKEHVKDGREHLNFSTWDNYSVEKKKHKIEECYEEVEESEMPLESYIMMHGEADFTPEQQEELITWFKDLEERIDS